MLTATQASMLPEPRASRFESFQVCMRIGGSIVGLKIECARCRGSQALGRSGWSGGSPFRCSRCSFGQ